MVSVVVVNWNGAPYLAECLASLRAQTLRAEMEVILVDNGSTDGSAEAAVREGLLARLIRNETNRGFAAACNQGIRASRGDYIALLNNDAVADPAWLAELVRAMEADPRIGSCAAKVLSYDARGVIDCVGHVVFADGLTRGRGRGQQDAGQFDRLEEVFCPSGSAALLRRAMLEDVGLFDEAFFAYCEDADLGFRARLRGWRCVYVPTAVAYHRFSASSGPFSAFKAFQVERNRLWLACKNLPAPLLLASPLHTMRRYAWQGYGALAGRGASGRFARERARGRLLWILAAAYLAALAGLPRVARQRAVIQARRTASTAEIRQALRAFGVSAREIALLE
ncbi:MAG: glycosyltransferase family 2 protein [Chloroflexi bacterium]|nr:glycosyltransferase family 2 protein [Chloroflexota bacterium]